MAGLEGEVVEAAEVRQAAGDGERRGAGRGRARRRVERHVFERRQLHVRDKCRRDRRQRRDEGGAEVGAQPREQPQDGRQLDGFFDVEVESVEIVAADQVAERGVVGLELEL